MRTLPLLTLALSACLPDFPGKTYAEDPAHDFDGDGVTEADGDCDDTRATVAPGIPETCDFLDNDCNGLADDAPVDPGTWYQDTDDDTYGTDGTLIVACRAPEGYVGRGGDCDDTVAQIHPGVEETCSSADDNCDGNYEVNPDAAPFPWFIDADRDGFGDPALSVRSCDPPPGYVGNDRDCDDRVATTFPTAVERCDGVDNDCDGLTDDDDPNRAVDLPFYGDADGDSFGDRSVVFEGCDAPPGFVVDGNDCDDNSADIHPGRPEVCDGVDQDCDSRIDEGVTDLFVPDLDGDGFGSPDGPYFEGCGAPDGYVLDGTDCDDALAGVNPAAAERCDDVDNDCDGTIDLGSMDAPTWFPDADSDGYGDDTRGMTTCDAPLGYTSVGGDCDDGRAAVSPEARESCATLLDDDCDGDTNDADAIRCVTFYLDNDGDGYGDSASSTCTCTAAAPYTARTTGDCDDSAALTHPLASERCATASDDDCDGESNEEGAVGCALWYSDADGDSYGTLPATCLCAAASPATASMPGDCDDTDAAIGPHAGNCGLTGEVVASTATSASTSGVGRADGTTPAGALVGGFDFNADGFDDVALGVPGFDGTASDSGAVFVFYGPITSAMDIGTATTAQLVYLPTRAAATATGSYLTTGDYDGDGLTDLVIGDGTDDLFVLPGTTSGDVLTDETDVSTLTGGATVAALGDIDSDGTDDWAYESVSSVTRWYGSRSGYGSTAFLERTSYDFVTDHYDRAAVVSADIDGDGDHDVALGGRFFSAPGLRGLIATVSGASDLAAYAVGDVNCDGYDDVAFVDPDSGFGAVGILPGAASPTSVSFAALPIRVLGTTASAGFATSAARAGDVDADGCADLLIGTESWPGTASTATAAPSLYYGPLATGASYDSGADATFLSTASGSYTGPLVAGAGDTDGDGFDDVLVGSVDDSAGGVLLMLGASR